MALSDEEGELLKGIVREYVELLDAERDPGDPVMARLFPSASLDDPTIETDFRDLAGDDLDQHKRQTATRVLDYLENGDRRPLTAEEQEAWLVLLTDLRLAMGVRLGVTEETFDTFPNPNDPAQWPLAVLHYLGSLQESLVEALDL
ncbi:MAG: hypothetical protein QOD62_579 [Actinomycetota bacterium]|nr:hypothetical protein [Actinomycetota bacterium]